MFDIILNFMLFMTWLANSWMEQAWNKETRFHRFKLIASSFLTITYLLLFLVSLVIYVNKGSE